MQAASLPYAKTDAAQHERAEEPEQRCRPGLKSARPHADYTAAVGDTEPCDQGVSQGPRRTVYEKETVAGDT